MHISILHLSDLHRDPSNPITNAALLNSLVRDLDRCQSEEPPIPTPGVVVVSGDIVQGVPANDPDPESRLAEQYDQAYEFLARLTDTLVEGDREKVVIVPGNHDVSLPHTMQSLKQLTLDPALPKPHSELVKAMFSPNSTIRWSWDSLSFFDIHDASGYHARFAAFCEFYQRFYKGTRKYSLLPELQYDIFDFPTTNILIAAFNSCFNNDPLNRCGAIHPDCLAKAAQQSRQPRFRQRLRLAVWHHGTSGGPFDTDYMDSSVLQVLIDNGFSLGLHGHQHRSHFIDEKYQFGGSRKITVVSTGTLCGGPGSLPPGHARGYNVIVLDTDNYSATVHQRRMQNEDFASPIWGQGLFALSGRSWIDCVLQEPPHFNAESIVLTNLNDAEELLRSRRFAEAAALLKPIAADSPFARRLLLEALANSDDAPGIVKHFYPPQATNEVVHVADALWTNKQLDLLRALLTSRIVSGSDDPSVVHIRNKYEARLQL